MALRRHWVGLVPLAVLIACGSSDGGGKSPDGDLTVVTCREGQRKVGTACVANAFFDEVVVPRDDVPLPIDQAPDGTRYVRGVLLVSVKDEKLRLDDARRLFTNHGGEAIGAIPFAAFYMVRFGAVTDAAGLDAKAAELKTDPAIEAVTRDLEVPNALAAPERTADTDLEKLPTTATFHDLGNSGDDQPIGATGKKAYENVGLPQAWNALYTQNLPLEHVTVGIVDGLVARERFPFLVFANAEDRRPLKTEAGDSPLVRHGTAVASIIAGPNGDGGMTGYLGGLSCLRHDLAPIAIIEHSDVEPELTDHAVKVRNDAILWGIIRAVLAGSRVVNLSVAGTGTGELIFDFAKVYRRLMGAASGTLFVMGAGNDGADASFYVPCAAARQDQPTKIGNAICVGAIDEANARSVWGTNPKTGGPSASNFNTLASSAAIGIAAPGTRVLATLPDGRLTMFLGTSAATPMVSGAAALLFSVLPGLDGALAKKILLDTAKPHPDAAPDIVLGGKRLDAGAAVERALSVAAQLHPERVGQGDCRPKDVAAAGTCEIGTCNYCGVADYNVRFPSSPENDGIGTTPAKQAKVKILWDNDTTIGQLDLNVRDANSAGLNLRFPLLAGGTNATMTGTARRGGAIDIKVAIEGFVDPTSANSIPGTTLGTIFGKAATPFSDWVRSFELQIRDTNGVYTGTVTARGDGGATFSGTLKDVPFKPEAECF